MINHSLLAAPPTGWRHPIMFCWSFTKLFKALPHQYFCSRYYTHLWSVTTPEAANHSWFVSVTSWIVELTLTTHGSLFPRRCLPEGEHVTGRPAVQPAAHPGLLQRQPEQLLPLQPGGHAVRLLHHQGRVYTQLQKKWFDSWNQILIKGLNIFLPWQSN